MLEVPDQTVPARRGKVILFYPPYDGPPLGAPLSLRSLADTLREANVEVALIDAAIEPKYLDKIPENSQAPFPRHGAVPADAHALVQTGAS